MIHPFDPTPGNHRAKQLLKEGRARVEAMDKVDARYGEKSPHESPLHLHLQVAMTAISAGLEHRDFGPIADALAMLQDAEMRVRKMTCGGER